MIRRAAVAGAVLGLALLAATPALAEPARASRIPKHIGPAVVAWYDEARPTASTPAAPTPGVGRKDLLVQGLTLDASQLPIPLPPLPPFHQITALTALSFRIPSGATPASLSLGLTGLTTAKLDAKLPSGATPIACATTRRFRPGLEQPFSAAPGYDCTNSSAIGQLSLDRTSIVFPGIGRLLTGHTLSLVILPGSLGFERLVFRPPTKAALSLLDFSQPASRSNPPPSPSPAASHVAISSPPLPGGPILPVTTPSVPPAPAAAPQVASQVTTSPQALTNAVTPIDDSRTRTAAIGGLVALIVITAWVSGTERRPRATVAGVGRFRAPRHGPPPAI